MTKIDELHPTDGSFANERPGPATALCAPRRRRSLLVTGLLVGFLATGAAIAPGPLSGMSAHAGVLADSGAGDTAQPPIPTGLRVAALRDGRVELDWADNPEQPHRYQVYRDGVLLANGPTASAYVDSGLTNGRSYIYRVSASASSGSGTRYSDWTPAVAAIPGERAPSTPADLTVVLAGNGVVELDWTDVADIAHHRYQVYRNGVMVADGIEASTYVDTAVTDGQSYAYRVSAGSPRYYSAWTLPAIATPRTRTPAVPAGLVATASDGGAVTLDWDDLRDLGEHRYQVYRNNALIANGPRASTYVDNGVIAGRSYTYRVSAGSPSHYSEWTSAVAATPARSNPLIPTGLAVVSARNATVELDWMDVPSLGNRTYQVYRDERLIADGVTQSRFVDSGLVGGETYDYRVSIGADPDYEPWTDPVSATLARGDAATPTPAPPPPPPNSSDIIWNGDLSRGTFSGFGVQAFGEAKIVTDVVRPGYRYAARLTTSGVAPDGLRRVHLHGADIGWEGTRLFYGHSLRVPSGFPPTPGHQLMIEWFGRPWTGSPPMSLEMDPDTQNFRVTTARGGLLRRISAVKDVWHDFVWEFKFSRGSSGMIKLWHRVHGRGDYQPVTFANGTTTWYGPTMHADMTSSHPIVGNYHVNHGVAKTVYHAANRAGRTFEAVAPR